ncbi:hypothetical protein ACS5PK_11230 [Roseateles sp. DB2]|uniref:hypothetical protein n=1 Tax=Roseateles sp. DB2 TaxID=3453717 RepID=UPI003EE88A0A
MASLFKYLPSKYLDAFVGRGELLFRSLSYFRNYEELEVRGDRHEGRRLYSPPQGLAINNLTTGEKFNLPGSFESSVQDREIFVFCLAQECSTELASEFKTDVCVEIHNPTALLAKVRAALMLRRWIKNARLLHGRVDYYSPSEAPLAEWAVPERMVLQKTVDFARQKEYRLAFARGNALQLNNVATQITTTPGASQPTLLGHPEHVLRLGSLAKLCTVHSIQTAA